MRRSLAKLLVALLLGVVAQGAVVGIDFGSEFIKTHLVKPGSFSIVVDEQSKRKVPAVVAFDKAERCCSPAQAQPHNIGPPSVTEKCVFALASPQSHSIVCPRHCDQKLCRAFGNNAMSLVVRKAKDSYLWAHRLLGAGVDSPRVKFLPHAHRALLSFFTRTRTHTHTQVHCAPPSGVPRLQPLATLPTRSRRSSRN